MESVWGVVPGGRWCKKDNPDGLTGSIGTPTSPGYYSIGIGAIDSTITSLPSVPDGVRIKSLMELYHSKPTTVMSPQSPYFPNLRTIKPFSLDNTTDASWWCYGLTNLTDVFGSNNISLPNSTTLSNTFK